MGKSRFQQRAAARAQAPAAAAAPAEEAAPNVTTASAPVTVAELAGDRAVAVNEDGVEVLADGQGPLIRHQYDIPDAVRAAGDSLDTKERAQQQKDAVQDATMARTLEAKLSGNGAFRVEDEIEVPIPLGPTPPLPAADQMRAAASFFELRPGQNMDEADAAAPAPVREFQQVSPELMMAGMRPPNRERADPDAPSIGDPTNPVAQVFGARLWTGNKSFDWCRDATTGDRHEFTFHFFEQGVLVDIYEVDDYRVLEREIRAEIAEKVAAIEKHNAYGNDVVGYVAGVRGFTLKPQELHDIKSGFVCSELRIPIDLPQTGPPDQYDSTRASSGDPVASGMMASSSFNWNRPVETENRVRVASVMDAA